MEYIFTFVFCLLSIAISAQQRKNGTLRLGYPKGLTYDTVLVTDSQGKIIPVTKESDQNGKIVNTYLIKENKRKQSLFSIYFGGSKSKVNDTLHFTGGGDKMALTVDKTFALWDSIHLKLKDVFSAEELNSRYFQYVDSSMRVYHSQNRKSPFLGPPARQFRLHAGFDFIKENINNPYSAGVFAVLVINPKTNTSYNEALRFYTKNMKNKIDDPRYREFIEKRINLLRQSLEKGNQAPKFSVHTIDGQLIDNKTFSGKNVLLIFWATWCGPCMKEVPYLKQIHKEYKGDNLRMISVSLDYDSLKMVKVINQKGLDWTHVYDNKPMVKSFRINALPVMILINEKGVIIYNSLINSNGDYVAELKNELKEKFGD